MNQPDKTDVASGWNSQVLCIGFAGYSAVLSEFAGIVRMYAQNPKGRRDQEILINDKLHVVDPVQRLPKNCLPISKFLLTFAASYSCQATVLFKELIYTWLLCREDYRTEMVAIFD